MTEPSAPRLDPDVRGYYERRPEETRLERGLCRLEAERTRLLVARHLPAAPATVLDVGGAAGAYALWLAALGHDVHLIDPVPRLVAEAARRSADAPRRLATCAVGDARALAWPDASVDVVLMLGPLYHRTASKGRRACSRTSTRGGRTRAGAPTCCAPPRWWRRSRACAG